MFYYSIRASKNSNLLNFLFCKFHLYFVCSIIIHLKTGISYTKRWQNIELNYRKLNSCVPFFDNLLKMMTMIQGQVLPTFMINFNRLLPLYFLFQVLFHEEVCLKEGECTILAIINLTHLSKVAPLNWLELQSHEENESFSIIISLSPENFVLLGYSMFEKFKFF